MIHAFRSEWVKLRRRTLLASTYLSLTAVSALFTILVFSRAGTPRGRGDFISLQELAQPNGLARGLTRAALLLGRGGELRGWGGQGFGDAEHRLPDVTLTPPADSPWGSFSAGGHGAGGPVQLSAAECAVLCGRIESPVPAFGVLVPLVLRDRTLAMRC